MRSVIMPKLGLTMEEGTIIRWLVEEGDEVKKGDVLFEAETDKSVNEVEAPVSGKLGKILFHDGATVDVLTVIGYILELNEAPPDQWPEKSVPPADAVKKEALVETRNQVVATPVAERMARELGVGLDQVVGTGGGGKITREDVLRTRESLSTKTITQAKRILVSPHAKRLAAEKSISLGDVRGSGQRGRITEKDVIDYANSKEGTRLNRLQQITAKRMVESFTKVPHFYLKIEVDASELVAWHKKISPTLERKHQIHSTISDLLIFLTARTLKNHPRVNAYWTQDGFQTNTAV